MSYRDEYHDEREDLPVRLRRSYGSYLISVDEDRDCSGVVTGHFIWSLVSSSSQFCAGGKAPNMEMALLAIEDILDTYAIRIRTTPDMERKGEGRPVRAE
jgi:hypothetical protein